MISNNFCILSDKFQRVSSKNKTGNTNVLTISAQHGLINQFEYYNHQYASENTSGYTLLHKGEFADNKKYVEEQNKKIDEILQKEDEALGDLDDKYKEKQAEIDECDKKIEENDKKIAENKDSIHKSNSIIANLKSELANLKTDTDNEKIKFNGIPLFHPEAR